MNVVDRARELRKQIEANANAMSDEEALKFPELFPKWSEDATYSEGQRVRHNGELHKTSKAHSSGRDKDPKTDSERWKKVEVLDISDIPEWEQPTKKKGYKVGDRVKFDAFIYENVEKNNIMSPADNPDGWREVARA